MDSKLSCAKYEFTMKASDVDSTYHTPIFSTKGENQLWNLRIGPSAKKQAEYLEVFLQAVPSVTELITEGPWISRQGLSCEIYIIDEMACTTVVSKKFKESPFEKFSRKSSGCGWPCFIKKSSLPESFILGICFSMTTAPRVQSSQSVDNAFQYTLPDLATAWGTMLDNPNTADVVFNVQGTKIYAHKDILRARSAYFRGMFNSGCAESVAKPTESNKPSKRENKSTHISTQSSSYRRENALKALSIQYKPPEPTIPVVDDITSSSSDLEIVTLESLSTDIKVEEGKELNTSDVSKDVNKANDNNQVSAIDALSKYYEQRLAELQTKLSDAQQAQSLIIDKIQNLQTNFDDFRYSVKRKEEEISTKEKEIDSLKKSVQTLVSEFCGVDNIKFSTTISFEDRRSSTKPLPPLQSVSQSVSQQTQPQRQYHVIEVTDFEPVTYRRFLHFLYTNRIPSEIALPACLALFKLSDKYQLITVRRAMLLRIETLLTIDNVATILFQQAYLYSDFKQICMEYLLKHYEEVTKTKSFELILTWSGEYPAFPEVMMEIMRSIPNRDCLAPTIASNNNTDAVVNN
ncbi:speckle-type poz protein a-like isoform x2 [Gigaspora margarita]|uniref:Speckle-type poz protein a-like isoform x2 n=1 Tax=Gigaspora margarita TaxID=4874 RepID=A0A8H3XBL1_GIGMA|nr:speckle-type poz protein a-like isoform x2 [Gigaspora margarita]